jgi:hypothetical protein
VYPYYPPRRALATPLGGNYVQLGDAYTDALLAAGQTTAMSASGSNYDAFPVADKLATQVMQIAKEKGDMTPEEAQLVGSLYNAVKDGKVDGKDLASVATTVASIGGAAACAATGAGATIAPLCGAAAGLITKTIAGLFGGDGGGTSDPQYSAKVKASTDQLAAAMVSRCAPMDFACIAVMPEAAKMAMGWGTGPITMEEAGTLPPFPFPEEMSIEDVLNMTAWPNVKSVTKFDGKFPGWAPSSSPPALMTHYGSYACPTNIGVNDPGYKACIAALPAWQAYEKAKNLWLAKQQVVWLWRNQVMKKRQEIGKKRAAGAAAKSRILAEMDFIKRVRIAAAEAEKPLVARCTSADCRQSVHGQVQKMSYEMAKAARDPLQKASGGLSFMAEFNANLINGSIGNDVKTNAQTTAIKAIQDEAAKTKAAQASAQATAQAAAVATSNRNKKIVLGLVGLSAILVGTAAVINARK